MYPHTFRRHSRTPPNASALTIIVMSSEGASLNASDSTGVSWPARMYAAYIPIQAKVRPTATNTR
jgi:hypothetical protein